MDKVWGRVIAALIMGVLLPRLVLSAGLWLTAVESPEPIQTVPGETEHSLPSIEMAVPVPVYIPVLTGQMDVEVMELENYVLGVVLAEMPAAFSPEALKAQAIVARTYALRRIHQADRHGGGAVCIDSSCCQAYISKENYLKSRGTEGDVQIIRQAVEATHGLVLMYGDTLVEATYFSCSGGRTEEALEVWGSDLPYLKALDSPGEESAVNYCTRICFTPADFTKALGARLAGDPAAWFGKTTYTAGGGVKTMIIGSTSYSGTQLRQLLGLNSTRFTVTVENKTILVETQGKGHRVGMSQYGADAMAAVGHNYSEILGYYYPGTVIDKVGEIG